MSDPQSRPRDGDRKRATAQVDAAYANGLITAADRALRVGNIDSAATLGELDLVVRDLGTETPVVTPPPQVMPMPAAPVSSAPLPPPPVSPASGPAWTGAPQGFRITRERRPSRGYGIVVVAVVGLMVLLSVGGTALVASLGGSSGSVDSGTGPFEFENPIDVPTELIEEPSPDRLALTEAGLRWFVGRYEDQFRTTRALRVTIWADRAAVDVPVHAGRRHESWAYTDGEFTKYGSATTNTPGTAVVDLSRLRLKALVTNIRRAKRTLRVEQPETIYVIISNDSLGEGPEAHIYVTNQYNESGYLATTFDGRVVRSFPFEADPAGPLRWGDLGSIVGGRSGGGQMQAKVGDRLVVESGKVDAPRREGEVLEVHGADGGPPFLVQWADGHQGLTFPGPDAHVIAAP